MVVFVSKLLIVGNFHRGYISDIFLIQPIICEKPESVQIPTIQRFHLPL